MTQFMQINEINHLSKALIYFAAIAAGIVNIVSLFAFFLKENRKQYVTYKILGATGRPHRCDRDRGACGVYARRLCNRLCRRSPLY